MGTRSVALVLALALSVAAPAGAGAADAGAGPSLQLSKVILDSNGSAVKGKLKVGTICLFGGGALKLDDRKITQDHERFENLFARTVKDRGYAVVATDADLFSEENASGKGDLLVGATLRLDELNLCSSVNGEKGTVAVSVEWKIFDRTAKKVVSTVVTAGQGSQEKFARDGLARMIDAAFVNSLQAAMDRPDVKQVVGTRAPVGAAPA